MDLLQHLCSMLQMCYLTTVLVWSGAHHQLIRCRPLIAAMAAAKRQPPLPESNPVTPTGRPGSSPETRSVLPLSVDPQHVECPCRAIEQTVERGDDVLTHRLDLGTARCGCAVEESEGARPHATFRIQCQPLLPLPGQWWHMLPCPMPERCWITCGLVASNPRSGSKEHAAATSFCFES